MPLISHYFQAYGSWQIRRLPTFQLSFQDRGIYPRTEFRMLTQNIESCNKSMQHKLEKLLQSNLFHRKFSRTQFRVKGIFLDSVFSHQSLAFRIYLSLCNTSTSIGLIESLFLDAAVRLFSRDGGGLFGEMLSVIRAFRKLCYTSQ